MALPDMNRWPAHPLSATAPQALFDRLPDRLFEPLASANPSILGTPLQPAFEALRAGRATATKLRISRKRDFA